MQLPTENLPKTHHQKYRRPNHNTNVVVFYYQFVPLFSTRSGFGSMVTLMKQGSITLLDLNMYQDFHLDTVRALIDTRRPDVLCLQEAPEYFARELAEKFGYKYHFAPMANVIRTEHTNQFFIGLILAWKPTLTQLDIEVSEYRKVESGNANWDISPNYPARLLLTATLSLGEEIFRIATTHFTWTPDGGASEEQRTDMKALLALLSQYEDEKGIIFCGDFNAPRGGEIFSMMSDRFTDHLPKDVVTTLDQTLHRAAPLLLAVDSMFSTKEYSVSEFELVEGVSDHKGLFAKVSKSVC